MTELNGRASDKVAKRKRGVGREGESIHPGRILARDEDGNRGEEEEGRDLCERDGEGESLVKDSRERERERTKDGNGGRTGAEEKRRSRREMDG